MVECDICKIQFKAAKPNEAVIDAPILGSGGCWGYGCLGHLSYFNHAVGTWLNKDLKAVAGR